MKDLIAVFDTLRKELDEFTTPITTLELLIDNLPLKVITAYFQEGNHSQHQRTPETGNVTGQIFICKPVPGLVLESELFLTQPKPTKAEK